MNTVKKIGIINVNNSGEVTESDSEIKVSLSFKNRELIDVLERVKNSPWITEDKQTQKVYSNLLHAIKGDNYELININHQEISILDSEIVENEVTEITEVPIIDDMFVKEQEITTNGDLIEI